MSNFLGLLELFLEEFSKNKEKINDPWTIEITKNENKSKEYNELGQLIILLSKIRNSMK